jgi:hypothetical protein
VCGPKGAGTKPPTSKRHRLSRNTECILDAAHSILDLAFDLLSPPFGHQFGITNSLANRRSDLAFDNLCRPNHTMFVHVDIPIEKNSAAPIGGSQYLPGFKPVDADAG